MIYQITLLFLMFSNMSFAYEADSTARIGDSVLTYYPEGNIKKMEFQNSLRERRAKNGLPVTVYYHENGFVSNHTYLDDKFGHRYLQFSPTARGCIIAGGDQKERVYVYENCQMIRKESPKEIWGLSMEMPVQMRAGYCIEEGSFQNFTLYNGTMKYYSVEQKLITTVKVIEGRRQNDPVVYFEDKILEQQIISNNHHLDLNQDGRIQVSEASVAFDIDLMNTHEIKSLVGWNYFTHLKKLKVGNRKIDLSSYDSDEKLLEVIVRNSHRDERLPAIHIPRSVAPPPPPVTLTPKEEIFPFPDVEAKFPGGPIAMQKWIIEYMRYPETAIELEVQGRVFIQFIVETDGSISNIEVIRGVSKELDREAKRIVRGMPKWAPGEANGKAIRTRITIPILFRLE